MKEGLISRENIKNVFVRKETLIDVLENTLSSLQSETFLYEEIDFTIFYLFGWSKDLRRLEVSRIFSMVDSPINWPVWYISFSFSEFINNQLLYESWTFPLKPVQVFPSWVVGTSACTLPKFWIWTHMVAKDRLMMITVQPVCFAFGLCFSWRGVDRPHILFCRYFRWVLQVPSGLSGSCLLWKYWTHPNWNCHAIGSFSRFFGLVRSFHWSFCLLLCKECLDHLKRVSRKLNTLALFLVHLNPNYRLSWSCLQLVWQTRELLVHLF